MIDTVHEHECLIFLLGFTVQFAGNLTYLDSYILAVWWQVLHVDFICPKPYFYNLYNKHYVKNPLCRRCAEVLQRGNTVFYLRKLWIYFEVCTKSDGSWKKISFVRRKCYQYVVTVIHI